MEARIAEIRDAGDPVSLIDLKPPAVAPETNAATYLQRVADDCVKLYAELEPHAHAEDFTWQMGLNAEQIAAVENAFAAYPAVLPGLEQASNCENCVWPLDYTLSFDEFLAQYFEPKSQPKLFSRIHHCRGRYLASVDKADAAVDIFLQQLRMARLQESEPLLINFLMNIAIRSSALEGLDGIVQTSELSPASHAAIEKELALLDGVQNIVTALKGERAFGICGYQRFPNPLGIMNSGWSNYLDFMRQQIDMGAKSQFELVDVPRVETQGMANLLVPTMEAARGTMNRHRASVRCLRILNAIQAQGKDAQQIEFESLGLPAKVHQDPFNGKPLTIMSTANGWLVHSVGLDGVDGGGK